MMEWREMGSEASAFPLAPRLRCDSPLILFGRHSLAAVCRKWRFPESLLGCGWTLNSPGASLKTLQPQQGIEIWSVGSNSYASHSYLIHSLAFDAMTSAGWGVNTSFDLITTVADGKIGCVVAVLVWWPRDQTNSFWSQTKQNKRDANWWNLMSSQDNKTR